MKRYECLLTVVIALALVASLVGCLAQPSVPVPDPNDFTIQALGPRPHVPYLTHMHTEVETPTWLLLVDLSDNTNYPHAATNNIVLKSLHYAGDLSDAVHWHWRVGVVTIAATEGISVEWVTGGARVRAVQFDERWIMPEHGLNLVVTDDTLPFVGTVISGTTLITSSTAITASAVVTGIPAAGDLILYLEELEDTAWLHFTIDVAYDTE